MHVCVKIDLDASLLLDGITDYFGEDNELTGALIAKQLKKICKNKH